MLTDELFERQEAYRKRTIIITISKFSLLAFAYMPLTFSIFSVSKVRVDMLFGHFQGTPRFINITAIAHSVLGQEKICLFEKDPQAQLVACSTHDEQPRDLRWCPPTRVALPFRTVRTQGNSFRTQVLSRKACLQAH